MRAPSIGQFVRRPHPFIFGPLSLLVPGGGGGTPVYGELPNGWTYRFSATQAVALDGRQLEAGVVPDSLVPLDRVAVVPGVDNIVEAAVAWLRE